ncbi:hypothetical protein GMORB2_7267 [Geosmithia morbida]|uniref:Flavin-nucleotide-binding protein n=1 Tax=Geosmithia morbida TaxID=1094350 RepID=A0A9P4YUG6_9HYPO|nr:uncharacterized protein GMORB2_7267 [Geosmithia morbida]KAF4122275.1 hypothetical protein GMORB2_7267 [Geosmithia morbida]
MPDYMMEPAYLRRNINQGTYDIESVKAVFDDSFIAHVSYVDNGLPACMPMIALVSEEDGGSGECVIHLHGHPRTRIVELVRESSREDRQPSDPVRVCITATKVDGLVLSSAPNGHSLNYRSATIHGTCSAVLDKAVKRRVMRDVTNHIVANRWEEVNPVASFQVSLVYVVRVRIDSMSVKSRTGPPGIQPRNEEADGPDVEPKAWAGVVPVWEQLGSPVDSRLTPGAEVSDNLAGYIRDRNARMKEYAERVSQPDSG